MVDYWVYRFTPGNRICLALNPFGGAIWSHCNREIPPRDDPALLLNELPCLHCSLPWLRPGGFQLIEMILKNGWNVDSEVSKVSKQQLPTISNPQTSRKKKNVASKSRFVSCITHLVESSALASCDAWCRALRPWSSKGITNGFCQYGCLKPCHTQKKQYASSSSSAIFWYCPVYPCPIPGQIGSWGSRARRMIAAFLLSFISSG